ncbi:MAG: hypothetical protein DRJ52_01835 [Thermoprotei archaeon]|nr:MAG: hypothetical protein DRJ52_01835 [Thermoprotei archaeon]RLE96967.1 MAG: hypothetical protein DRJ63_09810 [Thermoprotei archaeon]HDI75464.1 hypothetical protein [Thermoprotei archaeon]
MIPANINVSERKEKRLRLRRKGEVSRGVAKISPKAAQYLNIKDTLEVVIAGKKRYYFKVLVSEDVPENEVWCNEEELREYGIADKSIATCRAPLKEKE